MLSLFFLFFFFFLSVLRQLNSSLAMTTLTSSQCRLAPLIQVIQDCSHLYHFAVKLLFKLHACKDDYYSLIKCHLMFCDFNDLNAWTISSILGLPADTLQGHRDRFHDQFHK